MLVGELAERFSSYERFKICPSYITENEHMKKFDEEEKKLRYNEFIELGEYLKKINLYMERGLNLNIIGNTCMANNKHHTLILPDGKLAKCDRHYNKSVYGSIYSDKIDNLVLDKYKEYHEFGSLCAECAYLPNCIFLKHCPNTGGKPCSLPQRTAYYNFLENSIVVAYKNWSLNRQ